MKIMRCILLLFEIMTILLDENLQTSFGHDVTVGGSHGAGCTEPTDVGGCCSGKVSGTF